MKSHVLFSKSDHIKPANDYICLDSHIAWGLAILALGILCLRVQQVTLRPRLPRYLGH